MSLSETSGIRKFIPIINKLQDCLGANGSDLIKFDLPQIVVFGLQSAGKSTVLENFVSREFLPRGTGTVTRCPLILQMIQTRGEDEEYGEFSHKEGHKFTLYEEIREEIETQSHVLSNNGTCFTAEPIKLKIFSPHVLDLTLVDLPGLARISIDGSNTDLEQQTTDIIMKYIENENSLILAVIDANADIGTSDALKLARKVDDARLRTIGVLTKMDLLDESVKADVKKLLKKENPLLKLGFFGVANRSQSQIDKKMSVKEAMKKEKDVFKDAVFKDVTHRCGTTNLQTFLNATLTAHIEKVMPDLRRKIKEMETVLNEKLAGFQKLPKDDKLLHLIMEISNALAERFQTEMGDSASSIEHHEVLDKPCRGAEIRKLYDEQLDECLESVKIDELRSRHEILAVLTKGVRANCFTSSPAFESLAARRVEYFRAPCRSVIMKISVKLDEIITSLCKNISPPFYTVQSACLKAARQSLEENVNESIQVIEKMVNHEKTYMYTKHQNLHDGFSNYREGEQIASFNHKYHSTECNFSIRYRAEDFDLRIVSVLPPLDKLSARSEKFQAATAAKLLGSANLPENAGNIPRSVLSSTSTLELKHANPLATSGTITAPLSSSFTFNIPSVSRTIQLCEASIIIEKQQDRITGIQLTDGGKQNAATTENTITFDLEELATQFDPKKLIATFYKIGFYPDPIEIKAEGKLKLTMQVDKRRQVEEVHHVLSAYVNVAAKTLRSVLPKIVIYEIVDKQTKFFKNSLAIHLMQAKEELTKEMPEIASKKNDIKKELEKLQTSAQQKRATGTLVSLSEQNLVDCAGGEYGNNACDGGMPDNAFNYVKENGGLDTAESYAYVAGAQRCHFNRSTVGTTAAGFVDLPEGDEDALKVAVATFGPLSVAIDATDSFMLYGGGVFKDSECDARNLDHAVLVVGYGIRLSVTFQECSEVCQQVICIKNKIKTKK